MRGPSQCGENIVTFQVRIGHEDFIYRVPRRHLAEYHPDGDAHLPNAGLAAHDERIERDSLFGGQARIVAQGRAPLRLERELQSWQAQLSESGICESC